ncbi:MAG: hypothetical protein ACSHX9_13105 [Luteolibacter sp.]
MEPAVIIFGFAVIAILFRVLAGSFDGNRVEQYLREKNCELIDRSWDPFGPGWFGEKDSRIYEVVFRDPQGRVHRAHVKTSMMSGVYLTNDRIIEDRPARSVEKRPVQSVEEEKAALRKRLAELENE